MNLIEMAQNELGAQFVSDMAWFGEIDPEADAPILGLFEMTHMMYEADRDDEPSLVEMTEAAITALQAKGGENGLFLQVEAGRVDHANHAGNAARMVRDGVAFAEAVARADELTDDAIAARAADHLARLGVPIDLRTVATFSCGEHQRVAIARALAHDAGILLADEPTASLHREAADRLIWDLVALAREGGKTMIAVSHDGALLSRMDRVLTVEDGSVTADDKVEVA